MKTSYKLMPQFDRQTCIACCVCVDICPVGAIGLQVRNSEKGIRRYPVLESQDDCIGCRACEDECLTDSIMMIPNTQKPAKSGKKAVA